MRSSQQKQSRTGQSSFTLIETVMAVGLMVVIVLEVTAVQGRAISFSEYERKVTQASWLAKAVMGQLEYKWKFYDLKEIKASEKDTKFPTELCPDDPRFSCDYRYNITIDKWDLPLIDMAAASIGDETIAGVIKEQMKNIIGDDVLKVAHVEVTWPEGSRQNSVDLAYLLTGQQKLDQAIEGLKPVGAAPGGSTGTQSGTATGTSTQITPPQDGSAPPLPDSGGDGN